MSSSLLLFSTVDFVKSRHKHSVLGRCQHDDVLVFSEQLNRFAGFGIGLVRLVFTFFSSLVVYQVKSVDFNVKSVNRTSVCVQSFHRERPLSSLHRVPATVSGESCDLSSLFDVTRDVLMNVTPLTCVSGELPRPMLPPDTVQHRGRHVRDHKGSGQGSSSGEPVNLSVHLNLFPIINHMN